MRTLSLSFSTSFIYFSTHFFSLFIFFNFYCFIFSSGESTLSFFEMCCSIQNNCWYFRYCVSTRLSFQISKCTYALRHFFLSIFFNFFLFFCYYYCSSFGSCLFIFFNSSLCFLIVFAFYFINTHTQRA